MPLGVQYSGMWTLAQQYQAVGAGTWKNINEDYLWTWGINNHGQLGINSQIYRSSPVQIGTRTNWSSISGGQYAVMALQPDSTMWTWGNNTSGQLGDGTVIPRSSPVQIGSLTTWSKIAAAINHALAIKTDGSLWTWGLNNDGRLGDDTVINRSSPVQVGATVYGWGEVTTGLTSTLAIDLSGALWAWGGDAGGRLGNNTESISRSSPVQIGTDTTWSQVSSFSVNTLAAKTDGTMWSWGTNLSGQLGQNNGVYRSSPVQVGTLATWSKVSTGSAFSAAIKTDGTLWAWGTNASGQIGDNTVILRSSPVQVGALTSWSKISGTGSSQIAAIKTDGTLWSWGASSFGSIGDNTIITRSSPVQIGADTNWSQVALGDRHSVAVKTNGTLWTWGYNVNGQLGDNTVLSRSSPAQVGAGVTWLLVATSNQYHTIATKTDGTLWAWGAGTRGQLGNNASTTTNKISSPIQIGALTTWSKITAGRNQTLAIKTDTTLWSFGYNANGVLGKGDVIYRSSPVQVGSTPTAATTTWSLAAGGGYHSMAIKTGGTMWTWGRNINGNLGSNTTVYRSSPVQVGALTTWSKITAGFRHSVVIKTDGTMWSWGQNFHGALGDNTAVYRSSPVQIGILTTWSKIATGAAANFSVAIKTDGTMWTWGQANNGQLGLNDVVYRSSPVQVGALTTWSLIAGGKYHAVALKTDGTLWTWGRNIEGSVGDETILNRSSPVQIGNDSTWSIIAASREASMAIYHEVT